MKNWIQERPGSSVFVIIQTYFSFAFSPGKDKAAFSDFVSHRSSEKRHFFRLYKNFVTMLLGSSGSHRRLADLIFCQTWHVWQHDCHNEELSQGSRIIPPSSTTLTMAGAVWEHMAPITGAPHCDSLLLLLIEQKTKIPSLWQLIKELTWVRYCSGDIWPIHRDHQHSLLLCMINFDTHRAIIMHVLNRNASETQVGLKQKAHLYQL